MFIILQYSEVECNCVEKITEGLFRECIALLQHMYKIPMTVSKIVHTLCGGPLNFKTLGFTLPSSALAGGEEYSMTYYMLQRLSVTESLNSDGKKKE